MFSLDRQRYGAGIVVSFNLFALDGDSDANHS